MSEIDYLIVGHGIVGAVFAHTLRSQGKTVLVVDSPSENTSSRVAAGIMNPVTGKRLSLTWMAHDFFNSSELFYKDAEATLNAKFYHGTPIMRVFSSVAEQNDWLAKQSEDHFKPFVQNDSVTSLDNTEFGNPNGSLKVHGGGWLDVNKFLDSSQHVLTNDDSFKLADVALEDLKQHEEYVVYSDVKAKNVVFCTGVDNHNWGFLPFTPMKGEVLDIEVSNYNEKRIVIGGCFVSPKYEQTYYAGATYNWRECNLEPTDAAKTEILTKVKKFIKGDINVVGHNVGIRPAVKDRRPLLGRHPDYNHIYLCSGMGSKAVTMAPLLIQQLIDHIENGTELMKGVNLNRYL